mgnify:CR=1 FL=1
MRYSNSITASRTGMILYGLGDNKQIERRRIDCYESNPAESDQEFSKPSKE